MAKFVNLRGATFGRLLVLKRTRPLHPTTWSCLCSCGNKTKVLAYCLMSGRTKSCGCLASETTTKRNFRHGKYFTREHRMWRAAKARAKANSLEFSIDLNDVVIPIVCPILGISLVLNSKKPVDASPALDRINNNAGYIKGNIIVISTRANRIKSDATADELFAIAKFLEGHSGRF
jgi:hypothetical protein